MSAAATEGAFVYLIGSPRARPVKIGRSTDVIKRLEAMQATSPIPLHLMWIVAGGATLEAALHAHFPRQRVHGEWFDFEREDPVEAFIAALRTITDYHPHPEWILEVKANLARVNTRRDEVRARERTLRVALDDAKMRTADALRSGRHEGVRGFRYAVYRASPFSSPVVRAIGDGAGIPPDERYVRTKRD